MGVYHADQGVLHEPTEKFLQSEGVTPYIHSHHLESRDDVEAHIKTAKADYGLVIPSGFSEKVLQGQAASLEFVRGNDQVEPLHSYEIALGNLLRSLFLGSIQVVCILLISKYIIGFEYGVSFFALFLIAVLGIATAVAGLVRNSVNVGAINSLIVKLSQLIFEKIH